MAFFYLSVAFVVLFVVKYFSEIKKYYRQIKFSKSVPGPEIKELIANAKRERVLPWLNELRQRYGPIYKIWFGKDLTVLFSDPDDVKQILSDNTLLYKSKNYDIMHDWLGNGLLTSGGSTWHSRRKLLTPGFHFRILSEFKQPMEKNCDILIKLLNEKADGKAFDIYPFITLFALDIICETAMGITKNAQIQSESEYVRAVQAMCRLAHKQSFSFWYRLPYVFKHTSYGKEKIEAVKTLHQETLKTMALRKQKLIEEGIHTMTDAQKTDDIGTKRRLAFLDTLLIAQMEGVNLSDSDIREEVDTFMFEGHDTTSSAIAFAIYLLSQNSEAQEKAFEEAVAMEGREKETMKYLEAVIKETLRLYPSVPLHGRLLMEDYKIRDIVIPKGTGITVLTYMVHRDKQYYPDPEKFMPERFLNESEMHPFQFVAFSAGPRNCIGQKFAMLELKCSLAKILRSFKILPVQDFKPQPLAELVMKSGNGVEVKLEKRV
ncbi:hypothetical protein ACFFRR_002047 [Megaselia abdita]